MILFSNLQFVTSLWSKLSLLKAWFPVLPRQQHLGASPTCRLGVCCLTRSPGQSCAREGSRCAARHCSVSSLHLVIIITKYLSTSLYVCHPSSLNGRVHEGRDPNYFCSPSVTQFLAHAQHMIGNERMSEFIPEALAIH